MLRFRLHTLGRPRVTEAGGADVGLPAGKPLAALALLVLSSAPVTRRDLATLLWPSAKRDRARASVRQAVWTLRDRLGADVVRSGDGDTLEVPAGLVGTDLDLLDEALKAADVEAVQALWEGGPFRSFVVPDASGWNHWATELHALWEGRVIRVAETTAEGLPAQDRLRWTGFALQHWPYRGRLQALHIRALLGAGRLADALVALEDARSLVSPEAVADLAAVEAELEVAMGERRSEEVDPLARPPFVGRSAEFSLLSDALRRARGGHSQRVVVVGPAGIGKTRLAQEFVAFARASGVLVVAVRATTSERSVRFGGVADAIRQLVVLPGAAGISSASSDVLRSIVPSLGDRPAMTGTVSRAAVGDALLDLLDAVADESPLLLVVDDAHWSDADSRTLLHRARRLAARRPILLLETSRSEGADSFLRQVREDATAGLATIVRLSPLGPDDVTQVLLDLASFPSEQHAAEAGEALHAASSGYPLHLIELLRSLRQEGALAQVRDRWVLDVDRMASDLVAPPALEELLRRRLSAVSEEAQGVLGTLARAQVDSRAEVLRRASRLPRAPFAQALDELVRADLVRWGDGGQVEFSHDLVREAVLHGRRGSRRPLLRAVPVLLGLVLVLVIGGLVGSSEAEVNPLLGVTLSIRNEGGVMTFEPQSDGDWLVRDSAAALSEGAGFRPHFTRHDGSSIGEIRPANRGPDIAVRRPDGTIGVLLDGGGDDGLYDLSPDGTALLVGVEDTLASQYRMDLELVDLESGARTKLLVPEVRTYAVWTSTGREILAAVPTLSGNDYVVRLRPDGSEVGRRELPEGHVTGLRSCGDRWALVRLLEPRVLPRWRLLDWDSGRLGVLPDKLQRQPTLACTPLGDHFVTVDFATNLVRIFDAEQPDIERTMQLSSSPGSRGQVRVRWSDVTVPAEVVGRAPDSIAWGAQAPLEAAILDQSGRPARGMLEWEALDGEVVSVRGGVAFGNSPGVGRVVARVDGWLTDTVSIVVTGEAVGDLLFAEGFTELSEDVWIVVGHPPPSIVQGPQGPVASIGGDAVWTDGIRSHDTFANAQGLTATIQFRLPLTDRVDRQSVRLCLEEVGGGQVELCVMYPQGELATFDDRAVNLRFHGQTVLGFQSPFLGDGALHSLGLQLRSDGRFSAVVDGELIGSFPEPVLRPDARFRVAIYGRAEDTELLLRSVTVGAGTRY